MAHYMKHPKTALGHLGKHYERGKDETSEYVKFGNPQIDPQRTHLNYNLAPQHNHMEFINQRLSEVYCLNRKDVNVMCSWVVTAPKDLDPSQQDDFFKESYKFLENRYGKENVISSYVHLDETTPHMHFAFIPVVYDKKKNRYKVSAKERVNKFELKSFHSDYQEHLDKANIKCNVLNEATKEGNKSIEELKRGTAIETLNEIKSNIEALEGDLKALQGARGQIDHLNSIEVKKLPMGARMVNIDDLNILMDLAKESIKNETEIRKLKRELEALETKFDNSRTKIEKLSSKNTELEGKFNYVKKQAQCLKEAITEHSDSENILKTAREKFNAPEPKQKINLKTYEIGD